MIGKFSKVSPLMYVLSLNRWLFGDFSQLNKRVTSSRNADRNAEILKRNAEILKGQLNNAST